MMSAVYDGFHGRNVPQSLSAIEFIEGALAASRQGQGVNEWMDEVRTMPDSFYTAIKTVKGIDAAEYELKEVVKGRKYREVAASSTNIIAGAAELAKIETKVPLVELSLHPPSVSLGQMLEGGYWGASPKFLVVTNETPEFFRYAELRNSQVWSPYGTLGLQAIIVMACVEEKQTKNISVSLMLVPPVRFGRCNEKREGYVLVTLREDGDTNFDTLTCKIRQHHSVHRALGRVSDDKIVENLHMCGGDPDDHFGFPGSYEYLVGNLNGLGEYLTDLSVLMTKKK